MENKLTTLMLVDSVDKKHLPPGPWHNEADRVEFEAHGFRCLVKRQEQGHFACFVAIPGSHPWYAHGPQMLRKDSDVHGGITWTNNYIPGESRDCAWWVGFDFGHVNDFLPILGWDPIQCILERVIVGDIRYYPLEVAIRETVELARQARGWNE